MIKLYTDSHGHLILERDGVQITLEACPDRVVVANDEIYLDSEAAEAILPKEY